MEQAHQRSDRRHLSDLALETVWVADGQTNLDADHAKALARLGLGFSGGRFLVQAH